MMEKKQTEDTSPVPYGLVFLGWLVPGLGHFLLGKRRRAAVFGAVIAGGFFTGIMLSGEIGVPHAGNPFSWLATFASAGNGTLYLARLAWVNGIDGLFGNFPLGLEGGGDPIAAGFNYGKTFIITAGLMNLLAVLDVSDIGRGVKE